MKRNWFKVSKLEVYRRTISFSNDQERTTKEIGLSWPVSTSGSKQSKLRSIQIWGNKWRNQNCVFLETIFINFCSIAVTIYLDFSFQINHGNGLHELQDLFYGDDGITALFNLKNGLETKFSFSIIHMRKLKRNFQPSKEKLR